MLFSLNFSELLYRIPVLLVSFTIHELAHGYTSYRLGDPTAKLAGRLTLNPIKHIDPIGALLLLVSRFGWAKPVPINPGYYKNKKAGIMLTSFAGPLSNILLAILFTALFAVSDIYFTGYSITAFQLIVFRLMYRFIEINILLAAFNLIPIPPLDGSKILFSLLPNRIYHQYILPYEGYGMFVILALSLTGLLLIILQPLVSFLVSIVNNIYPVFEFLIT